MLDLLISTATKYNWRRLGVSPNTAPKLQSRANKTLSSKIIIPIEYFNNAQNIECIKHIANYVIQRNYAIQNVLYSLAFNLLKAKNILHKSHTKTVLNEYKKCRFECYADLLDFNLPSDEIDLLGLIYQCLLMEGEKNIAGAYYTPQHIAKDMTKALDFSNGEIFLDPACGSGAFILSLKNAKPSQIFGIDNNPLAVFMAKINMLIKFSNVEFIPQIYCIDYLANSIKNLNKPFDYIITNPPWGAYRNKNYKNTNIASSERFALFFVKSYANLKQNGIMKFLLPNAMLNVKAHRDLREFILQNGTLQEIRHYANIFSGVSTEFVSIKHKKYLESRVNKNIQINPKSPQCKIIKNNHTFSVPLSIFTQSQNFIFSALDRQDIDIIQKVKNLGKYNLAQSTWALGIVTGDNKNILQTMQNNQNEAIYTGKEIKPYRLKKPQYFIVYDRAKFQQVAKDEIYRASEKIVYKFISNNLVFAYDNSKALFLNSANILIPKIPNMSIKTVLGFLNSNIFLYLYKVLFGEIKVLKGNLIELPFPHITQNQDSEICALVSKMIEGNNECESSLQDKIYDIFHITNNEQIYIERALNGIVN